MTRISDASETAAHVKLSMATSATLSRWLDELSASIIKRESSAKEPRKAQDTFRKRVRKHNYARTNQFEVENRLDGLEEKFQILSLDNLSDALRQRRIELKDFELSWLPDLLDLFLHLSGDPARNQNLLNLYAIPPRTGTPPLLKWKDILDESPIDKRDKLWRIPDFRNTDDPGYDDDFSSESSVVNERHVEPKHAEIDESVDIAKVLYTVNTKVSDIKHDIVSRLGPTDELGEGRFIREILYVLRGFDSDMLVVDGGRISFRTDVSVRYISSVAMDTICDEVATLRKDLDQILQWLEAESPEPYINVIKHEVQSVVASYYRTIDEAQAAFVDPAAGSVISIIQVMHIIRPSSHMVRSLAHLLSQTRQCDSIAFLERLYSESQEAFICHDTQYYKVLSLLLTQSLRIYLKPVLIWLDRGVIDSQPFFVRKNHVNARLQDLWHDTFSLQETDNCRPPNFLKALARMILACGKTSAFLRNLLPSWHVVNLEPLLLDCLGIAEDDVAVPVPTLFEIHWHEQVANLLQSRTALVKDVLDAHCGLDNTLQALAQLYLHLDIPQLDNLEINIFEQIDKCVDSWNDRFRIKDMLEEALGAGATMSIIVGSVHTTSRAMQSRRMSVRILDSLSFNLALPWSLANIIRPDAMIAYRKIRLVLIQIRRAKYSLERTGRAYTFSTPISHDATDQEQMLAQVLGFDLLATVNSIYDHLTISIILPLTKDMRNDLNKALTIDDMIHVHHEYMTRMEYACLAATRLKTLCHTLISMLDLCIRYSDLVSNTTKTSTIDSDHEASSFTSAYSRTKKLRGTAFDNDSDEDDHPHPEGYSSFIVLDDNTSIPKELQEVKSNFKRQLTSFTDGLRTASRTAVYAQDLEDLADRLSWLNDR